MADKLDRIIGDYVNGRLEARIKSIESRYLYKQKVDNLGIRTAYSGGSEPESHVLNKEALENDEELIRLRELIRQIDIWYLPLIQVEKEVIRLKCEGYNGRYWYQVMQELDVQGFEVPQKKAKAAYYKFRNDIYSFVIHLIWEGQNRQKKNRNCLKMVHQPLFLLIYLYHEVISESKQNVIRSVGYTSIVSGYFT